MPSSASWRIAGTRPTVDTVILRADMPRPAGAGSVSRRTVSITDPVVGHRLAHAHEHDVATPRPGPPAISPRGQRSRRRRAPARRSPPSTGCASARAWPVAQNGQSIPHPACEDTHRVTRSRGFGGTASARTRPGRRRAAATATCTVGRRRRSRRGPGSAAAGTGSRPARSRRSAGMSVHCCGSSDQPGEVVRRDLLGAERAARPAATTTSRRSASVRSARCRGGLPRRGAAHDQQARWLRPRPQPSPRVTARTAV